MTETHSEKAARLMKELEKHGEDAACYRKWIEDSEDFLGDAEDNIRRVSGELFEMREKGFIK